MNALIPATEPSVFERLAGLADKFAAGRKSANTTRAYRMDLLGCAYPLGQCNPTEAQHRHRHRPNAWLMWCAANGIDPLGATHGDVSIWLDDMKTAGESSGTRARRLSAVSAWYRWLVRDEIATRNPADLDPRERPTRRAPGTFGDALSVKQAAAVLAAADEHGSRSGAIVALMLFCGARVTEISSADIEDFAHDRGQTVLILHGKGEKRRAAPMIPVVYERIHGYLATRRDLTDARLPTLTAGARPRRSLFATDTGMRVDRAHLTRLVDRFGRAAGIKGLRPHDLRRTFATLALDAGVPLRDVQDAMGHVDPRTTRSYDRSGMNPDRHPAYRLGSLIGS